MTATERFFEMARQKAKPLVYANGEPDNAAISKKRPSQLGCVPTAIRFVKALARRAQAMGGAPCLAGCLVGTATQSCKIPR